MLEIRIMRGERGLLREKERERESTIKGYPIA